MKLREIEELKKKYKNDNIVFIAVAIENKETFKDWRNIIERNLILKKQLFYDGSKQRIINEYKISSVPNYILLSLKGKMIAKEIEDPTSKETQKLIKKLLKEEE